MHKEDWEDKPGWPGDVSDKETKKEISGGKCHGKMKKYQESQESIGFVNQEGISDLCSMILVKPSLH